MIAYGYPDLTLASELELASDLGVQVLEILPLWSSLPDPEPLRRSVEDRGLCIHSAHGCWGGQAIKARYVDLASTDPLSHRESLEDLSRCIDWLQAAGGRMLVVHPGGLSSREEQPFRTDALARGLIALAGHAGGSDVTLCVENMPPGVHPGSRMEDLYGLVRDLALPEVGLALDTGHAQISADPSGQTLAAGDLLCTTHVHDNDGRRDTHDPPGRGIIDWPAWGMALDRIGYSGPIMLECVRQLRKDRALLDPLVIAPLLNGGPST